MISQKFCDPWGICKTDVRRMCCENGPDLQEADSHEEEAVGADASGEDFVKVPLQ